MSSNSSTPLESFIAFKADTLSQCGNYSIDIPPLKEGEQYRFHFDTTACVGCHCCEAACNEQNGNSSEIKWRLVGELEGGVFPHTMQFFNSMSCNHCIDPACLKGCPTESYTKLDNGIVFHEDDTCIGCQYCTWNCPYEVPVFDKNRGIVTKCHMCHEKLEKGQTPACIQACPAGAIQIEVVHKEEWIQNDMAKEGIAPNLVDVNVTKPTTRYTLPDDKQKKELLKNLKPANDHSIKPAHSELPLVFMTVLSQISLGGIGALFFGMLLKLFGFENLAQANFMMSFLVLLPLLIGLPLSALHLGRPILAHTAMKNIKTSWLSREALALGLFAGFGIVSSIGYFFEQTFITASFLSLALVSALYGVYAQSMIYRVPARPSWNRVSTTKRFFSSSFVGFILVSLILSVQGQNSSAMTLISLALLVAAYQVLTIYEEKTFYKYLDKEHSDYYELNRTKYLLENEFKTLLQIRYNTLIAFGVVLPMLASLFLANNDNGSAQIILSLSFIGALISELIGRYIFYVSVQAKGLAGNFFAGNQRN
jgi:Fe-S-cluster-containing dehydrogenase component/DMSO reductase anchor subunit